MIRPRRFEKLMAQALADISNGETPIMPAPNKADTKEDKKEVNENSDGAKTSETEHTES